MCSEKDMVPEMVYLLGKIGDNKKALNLIIERLDDVKGVGIIMFRERFHDRTEWPTCIRLSSLLKSETTMISGKIYCDTPRLDLVSFAAISFKRLKLILACYRIHSGITGECRRPDRSSKTDSKDQEWSRDTRSQRSFDQDSLGFQPSGDSLELHKYKVPL